MNNRPALTLLFASVLAVASAPAAAVQADPHQHEAAEPAAQAAHTAAKAPDAAKATAEMRCDPEMHEKMMERMERMEAMMEKMHAGHPTESKQATGGDGHEQH